MADLLLVPQVFNANRYAVLCTLASFLGCMSTVEHKVKVWEQSYVYCLELCRYLILCGPICLLQQCLWLTTQHLPSLAGELRNCTPMHRLWLTNSCWLLKKADKSLPSHCSQIWASNASSPIALCGNMCFVFNTYGTFHYAWLQVQGGYLQSSGSPTTHLISSRHSPCYCYVHAQNWVQVCMTYRFNVCCILWWLWWDVCSHVSW